MTHIRNGREGGYSLIELMITVVIVGLLATIALGVYTRQAARTKRSAAQSFMFTIANKNEQFLLDARGYAANVAALGVTVPSRVSANYTVTMVPDNTTAPPSFVITATPTGTQATQDASCGTLTLNQNGVKTASGSAGAGGCW